MAVLVCGGAGYIGSHMVRFLLERGEDVLVLDDLSTGHRDFVPPSVPFVQGDVRDATLLGCLFREHRVDAVFHFAAFIQVGESMRDPLAYYDNNLQGVLRLLQTMVRHGVENFVFSSTAAVYGEPELVPIPEDAPKCPTNPYGETKLAVERLLHWTSVAHDLRWSALRYFNACGAALDGSIGEAHDPETHLIPLVLDAAMGRRPSVTIFGDDYDTPDGTCIRDYVHVMDLVEAHLLALNALRSGRRSSVYNLGNGRGFSVLEVVEACRRVTGRSILVEKGARRPGDPARLVASSARIREELGWEPRYTALDAIVETAWRWHGKRWG
jgi:UDP-glucose 4-epimerase